MSAGDWFGTYWWTLIPLIIAGVCYAVAEKTHNPNTDAKCRKWCRFFVIIFLLCVAYAGGVWRGSHLAEKPEGNQWDLSQGQNQ